MYIFAKIVFLFQGGKTLEGGGNISLKPLIYNGLDERLIVHVSLE